MTAKLLGFDVDMAFQASTGTEATVVNAASVAASAWSVLDGQATLGKRWMGVSVISDKAYTLRGVGAQADFSAIANGRVICGSTIPGNAATTGTGGDYHLVSVAGLAFACPQVQNNDAATAATVTVSVIFFD